MKKGKVRFAAGCVTATLLVFIGCGERSGEKEYNKALAAWKDGELVQAQSLLEKAIRKTSGNEKKSFAYNQLGLILWQLGKVQEAANAFNESCALAETLSGANLNLGIALFPDGKTEAAQEALSAVVGKDPGNQTALALLGMIAMQQQDWAGAADTIGKAVKIDPRNPAGQNALALAELQRDRATAVKRLKTIISAYPDYAPAAYNLGVIHEQLLHDKNAALSWYRQYLQKAASGGSHTEAANQAVARLSGRSAPESGGRNPAAAQRFLTEGGQLLAAGKFNAAISSFEQAVAADPGQKEGHYNLGYAYFKLKKYEEAADAFTRALSIDSAYADARYNLAYAYCLMRKWNEADREARELLQTDRARGEQMIKYIDSNRRR